MEIFFPVLFPGDQFKQAETDIDRNLTLVDPPVRTILDLCFGPEWFTGLMAGRGFMTPGIDWNHPKNNNPIPYTMIRQK